MKKKANLESNKRFKLPNVKKPKITAPLAISIRKLDKIEIEKYCYENDMTITDFVKIALIKEYPLMEKIFQYKRGK